MKAEPEKPNIFSYFNYREYFAALFKYSKEINPIFSHRYLVSKAGYKSPNSLKNVINGERHLSIQGVERFGKAFKLSNDERNYLITLARFNTANSQKEKERWLAELFKLRKTSLPVSLKDEQLEIMRDWWHIAIREITALPDFKNSSHWVSRVLMPEISREEASSSLRLLKKLKLIRKTKNGWEPVENKLQTNSEVKHVLASKFHEDMIQLGKESITRFPHSFREISGTTLRISEKDISRVKSLLQNFRKQLLEFAETSEDADQIFQLNFQFFPLVKPERPKRLKKNQPEQ